MKGLRNTWKVSSQGAPKESSVEDINAPITTSSSSTGKITTTLEKKAIKRKAATAAKKRSKSAFNFDNLNWKQSALPSQALLEGADDGLGGFYGLEELDGVDCIWTGDERTGRLCEFKYNDAAVKSKKRQRKAAKGTATSDDTAMDLDDEEALSIYERPLTDAESASYINLDDFKEGTAPHSVDIPSDAPASKKAKKDASIPAETAPTKPQRPMPPKPEIPDVDTSAWRSFHLKEPIISALKLLNFSRPTSIQEKTLPLALAKHDIIGAAATGSGKTLAFGIPIIQALLQKAKNTPKNPSSPIVQGLTALILAPTRELAIQVKDHLTALATFSPSPIHILPIVGGMAIQKQKRLLAHSPDIIVATPGRLWELLSEDDSFLSHVRQLRFLVIDEADRMLETGHFKELTAILKSISRRSSSSAADVDGNAPLASEPDVAPSPKTPPPPRRQTFIFSATLGAAFVSQAAAAQAKKRGKKLPTTSDPVSDLLKRIEFDDPKRQVVDDTVGGDAKASTLTERRVDCVHEDKEALLYYFLTRYPGRTLVFVNSIDAARRIVPILQLLRLPAHGLHAQMQQRARLRSIERFREEAHSVLVATDVAARGLDIPQVEHVIHYQIPRSGQVYVHRSGRTARAGKEGLSTLLCGAEENKEYKKLCGVLGNKGSGIAEFPVDRGLVTTLKARVALAQKINAAEHQISKVKHEDDWFLKQAEAMDIIVDPSLLRGKGRFARHAEDTEEEAFHDEGAKKSRKILNWRSELDHLMSIPVMPRGTSAKYPTSGAMRDLPKRLMRRDDPSTITSLPGHESVDVVSAATAPKQK